LEKASEVTGSIGTGSKSITVRLARLIKIAPEGMPIALCVGVPGILAIAIGLHWAGAILVIASVLIASFFRDPERKSEAAPEAILSGADGRVCDIREGPMPGGASDEVYRQVSVFMSPLNVHVNRAPASGKILNIQHTSGDFRAAFRDEASEHNERNMIILKGKGDRRYGMVQIAGYLARRIVCRVHPEDTVERGQRLGLIMFGSRVDHFIPRDFRVTVKIGDRVQSGISVIGEL
jgi:phosphatidylserine decarboxylase